jgi:hypothetical protein
MALENGVVPVVYDEADYWANAPSYSYVNARDFGSPTELAEYLWFLHQHDHLYQNYFSWNQDYIYKKFLSFFVISISHLSTEFFWIKFFR